VLSPDHPYDQNDTPTTKSQVSQPVKPRNLMFVVLVRGSQRFSSHQLINTSLTSGSYDRASWAKYEVRRPTKCNN